MTGYGLGASAGFVSTLIGVYVVSLLLGAPALPLAARLLTTRGAMLAACLLVALGYGMFLPLPDTPRRRCSTSRSPASAPASSSPRCPLPPRPPPRPTAPASSPG